MAYAAAMTTARQEAAPAQVAAKQVKASVNATCDNNNSAGAVSDTDGTKQGSDSRNGDTNGGDGSSRAAGNGSTAMHAASHAQWVNAGGAADGSIGSNSSEASDGDTWEQQRQQQQEREEAHEQEMARKALELNLLRLDLSYAWGGQAGAAAAVEVAGQNVQGAAR